VRVFGVSSERIESLQGTKRMPVKPDATTEITAFRWVPPFAEGLVRDLRIRWALEEIGRDYRVRLLDAMNPRPADYFAEQPFGQVPAYRDDEVQLFESGAILIHLGIEDERLLAPDLNERMRAIAWLIAALNSVEPMIFELVNIDIFNRGQGWTKERRPQVVDKIEARLKLLSDALGEREWFEDRFTIGDLMMVSVLRSLRHTDLVARHSNLAAFVARGEARPAFQRALNDQLAVFADHQPEPEGAVT
jgi:glutathione S-transferase